MSVSQVIAKMTAIQERLRELASDVENIQIAFDGQTSPDAPPKMDAIAPSNFIGATLVHEEYIERLLAHLQGKLNYLANSLYPNSAGAKAAEAATRAMAQKLAPISGLPRSPDVKVSENIPLENKV